MAVDSARSGNGFFSSSSWFRSEPMEYISVIMNEDAAYECLIDVGKLGAIQFTDVSFQDYFTIVCLFVYVGFLSLH